MTPPKAYTRSTISQRRSSSARHEVLVACLLVCWPWSACRQDNHGLDGLKEAASDSTPGTGGGGGNGGSSRGGRGGGSSGSSSSEGGQGGEDSEGRGGSSRGGASGNGGRNGFGGSVASGAGGSGKPIDAEEGDPDASSGSEDPASPDAEPEAPTSEALAKDVVLYLPFDEGTPEMPRDFSVHHHTATLRDAIGIEAMVPGRFGGGLALTGGPRGGFVVVESSPALSPVTTDLTLAAWVMLPADGLTTGTILARRAGGTTGHLFSLRIVQGKANGRLNSGNGYRADLTDGSPLPTKVWVHLALTFDSRQAALYVNGRQSGATPYLLPLPSDRTPVIVGGAEVERPITVVERLGAHLDEILIYQRALPVSELEELAGGTRPRLP